jgi:hypothetical protein
VDESNEFDVNVVIKLPFDDSKVMLNYSDSSPSYTLLEIPKEIVKSHKQEYDMFTEDPQGTTNYISGLKLDQHLNLAMNRDLNMLNNNGGSRRGGLKSNLDFSPKLFTNFMIYKSTDGWKCFHDSLGFKVDLVCCINLSLSALKSQPVIPYSLMKIREIFPDMQMEDTVRLVPKTSPKFIRSCRQQRVGFILNFPNIKQFLMLAKACLIDE